MGVSNITLLFSDFTVICGRELRFPDLNILLQAIGEPEFSIAVLAKNGEK
jgi:hypothetical protein